MKIAGVWAREILDSRGNPTVEADVVTQSSFGGAAAPSGASTGKYEAVELRDGGKRYGGKGVLKAVENVRTIIGPGLEGMDASKQQEIDLKMRSLDGTGDKSRLGANAMVAVSMAVMRAAAAGSGKQLYEYIGGDKLPQAMFNVINGGKHAGGKLAIQEFMIMPEAETFAERLQMASEIYHTLGQQLEKKYGKSARNVGDEGGYAPQLASTGEALDALVKAVEETGYAKKCPFAMDSAASSFYDEGKSRYDIDGVSMDQGDMIDFYKELANDYNVKSMEDPLHEDDFEGFAKLKEELEGKVQIVGDDLLVTNIRRIKEAIKHNSVSALLLKVNQIGTVSEALDAVKLCRDNNLRIVVSHRSGETEDCFISDFAVGINAEQLKSGAPARGERTAKYNQLLRIEERMFMQKQAAEEEAEIEEEAVKESEEQ